MLSSLFPERLDAHRRDSLKNIWCIMVDKHVDFFTNCRDRILEKKGLMILTALNLKDNNPMLKMAYFLQNHRKNV